MHVWEPLSTKNFKGNNKGTRWTFMDVAVMSPFSLLLTLSNYFQTCSLSIPSENRKSLKESIGLKWLDLVSKVVWSSGINLSLFEKVLLLLFLWCWKPWRQYHYRLHDNFGTLRTGHKQRLYLVEVELFCH